MKSKRLHTSSFFKRAGVILLVIFSLSVQAKTRWSALHFIPDADLLQGGQYVVEAGGFYFSDTAANPVISPTGSVTLGIIEWVNFDVGYSGGPTIGFKAKIFNENGSFIPSLALGVHNILSNREAGLFVRKDTIVNEVYLALAKSIDPLKMRIHLGIQTAPGSQTEQVNPFFAIEEYFGGGLYASLEVYSRKQEFHPCLFLSYRLLKKQLEISVGAVRINRLFFDQNNQFQLALGNKNRDEFVKPGIWLGIRYSGNLGFNKKESFTTLEDRVAYHTKAISSLSLTVDSLRKQMLENSKKMAIVNQSILNMTDSIGADKTRLKPMLLDKITAIKIAYSEEPFDPERVRRLMNEIVSLKENAMPGLREILLDKTVDKKIRILCVSLLGDIANSGASDVLLDVLSQTQDFDIKIEICIALGKMKETRAAYVLQQLGNDPVDAVAFTAQEVLAKLIKDTGMRLTTDYKARKIAPSEPQPIVETKIRTIPGKDTVLVAKPSVSEKSTQLSGTIKEPQKPVQPVAPNMPVVKSAALEQDAKKVTALPVTKENKPGLKVQDTVSSGDVWQVDSVKESQKSKQDIVDKKSSLGDTATLAVTKEKPIPASAPESKKNAGKKQAKPSQKKSSTPEPEEKNW